MTFPWRMRVILYDTVLKVVLQQPGQTDRQTEFLNFKMGDGSKKIPKFTGGGKVEPVGDSMGQDRHAQLEPQRKGRKNEGKSNKSLSWECAQWQSACLGCSLPPHPHPSFRIQ